MAFAATAQSINGTKSSSRGPFREEILTFTCISGDTSGVVTSSSLHVVYFAEITTVKQSALPTYSGNTVTFSFADPVATVFGQIRLIGA